MQICQGDAFHHMYRLPCMKISCFLALTAILPATIYGQNREHADSVAERDFPVIHRIGMELRPGYIFPTNPFLKGNNSRGRHINTAISAHIRYAFQFHPDSYTGTVYPDAYQGIGCAFNSFGSRTELGNPVTAYVFQGAPIYRFSPKISFNYEWNFGAAFGWHPYDAETNPFNRVIGSRINAYLNVGFFFKWQLSSHWLLNTGIDLTHYSNGNTKYPNGGLNLAGGKISLTYIPNPADSRTISQTQSFRPSFRQRLSCDAVIYGTWRRKGVFIDDKAFAAPGMFAVAGLNINPMYTISRRFKAGISLDAQYDESANIEQYIATSALPEELKFYRPPLKEQIGIGLSVRGEYVMPFFSINAGIGHNIYWHGKDLKGFYQILALKFSLSRHWFLHTGYQLHDFHSPNNLMLGIGYRFNRQ